MKRILLGTLIALSSLTTAVPVEAGRTFGLFVGLGRCHNHCDFCIRQYNAFTPVCSGSLTCDGCVPFANCMPGFGYSSCGPGMCGPGMCGPGMCGPGMCGPGMCGPGMCGPGMCGPSMYAPGGCDSGYAGGMIPSMPQQPIQVAPVQPQMPSSGPVLMAPGHTNANPYANSGYNVQPVGYYPNYGYAPPMPAYPPMMMNNWNPMGQVPYYWYPMGGR